MALSLCLFALLRYRCRSRAGDGAGALKYTAWYTAWLWAKFIKATHFHNNHFISGMRQITHSPQAEAAAVAATVAEAATEAAAKRHSNWTECWCWSLWPVPGLKCSAAPPSTHTLPPPSLPPPLFYCNYNFALLFLAIFRASTVHPDAPNEPDNMFLICAAKMHLHLPLLLLLLLQLQCEFAALFAQSALLIYVPFFCLCSLF